ncbi:hypothetical protein OIU78_009577 [Salix suchowensis]|nr:hypothetical protein OIU78_009577 [Salix suchowensis]
MMTETINHALDYSCRAGWKQPCGNYEVVIISNMKRSQHYILYVSVSRAFSGAGKGILIYQCSSCRLYISGAPI